MYKTNTRNLHYLFFNSLTCNIYCIIVCESDLVLHHSFTGAQVLAVLDALKLQQSTYPLPTA